MNLSNLKQLKSSSNVRLALVVFVFFVIWRIGLYSYVAPEGEFDSFGFSWGATYQFMALFGAAFGLVAAKQWGGVKSIVGKAATAFSIGLLLQSFGQIASSVYVFKFGEIPYPGIGDIGFFGSILFYIYGVTMLAKCSGVSLSLQAFWQKSTIVFIFLLMVSSSYFIFLKGQHLDWSDPVTSLLNIAYPVLQACYVSIALLTIFLSHSFLGGLMRGVTWLLVIALFLQYTSDFTFLYQAVRGLYIPEGLNDIMYLVSYFFMAVSLAYLGIVYRNIKES